jgi:hypothetical protein
MGTYPVPADRFQILFPYTVERDRAAWRWSGGVYAQDVDRCELTTSEMRKMTGKAAEIAAILTRFPLHTDYFKRVEEDLLSDGVLNVESRAWICFVLSELPLLIDKDELRERVLANRSWYAAQIMETEMVTAAAAQQKANAALASLFSGWRNPVLRRTTATGEVVTEEGVPLRAMVAYLFGEVAKNFYLIHHAEEWIECVRRSQAGDRCFEIDPDRLPSREEMEREIDWERGSAGPERLAAWLERYNATPFDFNRGLDDASLSPENPPQFERLEGSNFFRGLALIDLAEAMLIRAFGRDAAAVRVNAAGQGDYFQVHVDTQKAQPAAVKRFLSRAFYRRFGLAPSPEFVELHPGGGAAGIRIGRYDEIPQLARRLQAMASATEPLAVAG